MVAKTSLLQVFSIKSVQVASSLDKASVDEQGLEAEGAFSRLESNARLVLVGEYSLSGTVTSLAKIKVADTKSGGEALLVSFKDAKVSLVEWDPENYRISTVSIHYYEGGKVPTAPFGPPLGDCDSRLTVDPRSRCAALKFGVRHLAIVPFRQPDDDIAEADYDPDPDEKPAVKSERKDVKLSVPTRKTPYAASFVLPLTALDPALTHPVDIAFLYEYREPTFGIVSANKAASAALLDERKDPLAYTVYTLDLDQRASTTLLSVTGLPYDIFHIIALPPPVGGSLLVGANELIHIDQAGKTNAVAINEFAKQCSDFSMADQSSLGLRLENCAIQTLGAGSSDMLLVLGNGELAILTIRLDGRTVSGLSVHVVDSLHGNDCAPPGPTSTADLGKGRFFIGSDEGDSLVIGWTQKTQLTSRKRSHAEMIDEEASGEDEEDDDMLDDDAEDDLYGGDVPQVKKSTNSSVSKPSSPAEYIFRIHDRLKGLGPINAACLGKQPDALATEGRETDHQVKAPLSLLTSVGRGKSSSLACLQRDIVPVITYTSDEPATQALWSLRIKRSGPAGTAKSDNIESDPAADLIFDAQHDQYLVVYDSIADIKEESRILKIKHDTTSKDADHSPLQDYDETEFEGDGETLNMGVLAAGTRIVQVRRSEIRSYDNGKYMNFPHVSDFCMPFLFGKSPLELGLGLVTCMSFSTAQSRRRLSAPKVSGSWVRRWTVLRRIGSPPTHVTGSSIVTKCHLVLQHLSLAPVSLVKLRLT